jgi:hypothetical protein
VARKVRRVRKPSANRDPETEASGTSGRRDNTEALAEEYAYVIQDLRRILVLAVVMFGILILLNVLI